MARKKRNSSPQRRENTAAMDRVREIADSEEIKSFLLEAEKYKPFAARLPGLLAVPFGAMNYKDSTDIQAQMPAAYAMLVEFPRDPETHVLYVASSYGLGMKMIEQAGYKNVTGIDIDMRALEFTASHGLDTLYGNASSMAFEDGEFDAVVSRDFVEFIYLPSSMRRTVLDEMHRVLRPGGKAIFTTLMDTERRGYKGMPKREDIYNSAFRNSNMKEHAVVVPSPEGDMHLPIRVYSKGYVPVRYFSH